MISVSSGSGLQFTRGGPRLSGLGLDLNIDSGITTPTGPTINPQETAKNVRTPAAQPAATNRNPAPVTVAVPAVGTAVRTAAETLVTALINYGACMEAQGLNVDEVFKVTGALFLYRNWTGTVGFAALPRRMGYLANGK